MKCCHMNELFVGADAVHDDRVYSCWEIVTKDVVTVGGTVQELATRMTDHDKEPPV